MKQNISSIHETTNSTMDTTIHAYAIHILNRVQKKTTQIKNELVIRIPFRLSDVTRFSITVLHLNRIEFMCANLFLFLMPYH